MITRNRHNITEIRWYVREPGISNLLKTLDRDKESCGTVQESFESCVKRGSDLDESLTVSYLLGVASIVIITLVVITRCAIALVGGAPRL